MNRIAQIIGTFILTALATGAPQAEQIWITAGTDGFSGLLLEGSGIPNVGVIFFHGRNGDPDGHVVGELRQSLNADGYTTLSIENPTPPGAPPYSFKHYLSLEDTVDDLVFGRVKAAVDELVTRNSYIDTVVLGGFSLGSRFATAGAAAWQQGLLTGINPGVQLAGLVGVSMYSNIVSGDGTVAPPATPASPTTLDEINIYDTVNNLALINSIPALDIYGDLDTQAASLAGARSGAFGGDPLSYAQIALGCPDFINATYYANNGGAAVPYAENHCHQLRNGFLSQGDIDSDNPAVVLRGSPSAPLESAASDWFAQQVPLTPIPVPASLPLMLSAVVGTALFARRRRPSQ